VSTVPEWEAHLHITVYAHLNEHTPLSCSPASTPGQVALHLRGTNAADITLFSGWDELVRLQALVADALASLTVDGASPDSAELPAA
jgi:hypothetical protein